MNNIKLIKELKQEYNTLTQNIINVLNSIETNQKAFINTKLDVDKFSAYLKTFRLTLKTLIIQNATNNEYLNNKIKEPSRSIGLISLKEQLDLITELINQANIEIKKHNNIVTNYANEKNNLIKAIWKYLIEEHRTDTTTFNKKKDGIEKGIANLEAQHKTKQDEYRKLDTEIKNLNKNVTSINPLLMKLTEF